MKLCYKKNLTHSHRVRCEKYPGWTGLFCPVVFEVTVLIRAAVNHLCTVSSVIKLASTTLVSNCVFLEDVESICPQWFLLVSQSVTGLRAPQLNELVSWQQSAVTLRICCPRILLELPLNSGNISQISLLIHGCLEDTEAQMSTICEWSRRGSSAEEARQKHCSEESNWRVQFTQKSEGKTHIWFFVFPQQ